MNHRDLFDPTVHDGVLERLGGLTEDTAPQWGTMDAAQMCAHCSEVLEVSTGKPLEGTPWYVGLMRGLIKKLVLSDRPYPRSTRTHPQYVVTSDLDFAVEHARLLGAISAAQASAGSPKRHPLFGQMTAEENGWAAYKHLDHHLTQFGL